ncbi:MAG: YifB family Mg chelatase-like AAA ATPase [Actinomycetes bacterium]
MLARCSTFALDGLEPVSVSVELDVRPGLPGFSIVGLGDAAVRESRERVRAALLNSGFEFPLKRIVANLAPASLRKAGPGFDAALAAALLAASEQVPLLSLEGTAVFGEISLGGEIRGCRGTLAAAEGARAAGIQRFLVAEERACEAGLVEGLAVGGVRDLRELASLLAGRTGMRPPRGRVSLPVEPGGPDLADVKGQGAAVEALTIAAAGGHNLLIEGPPGVGKTMLARRLPGLLPPLRRDEALAVTRIQSVAGLHSGDALVSSRPFRAPHHTISPAGLVGGGSVPTPGEVTLAHLGVLFLDELSEFPRHCLDSLRQPLEDGFVTVVRRGFTAVFPSQVTVVAATNPCPCGHAGDSSRCKCDQRALDSHSRRLSGPLLDRFDLLVTTGQPTRSDLEAGPSLTTVEARRRVLVAREMQLARWGETGVSSNHMASESDLRAGGLFGDEAVRVVGDAYDRGLIGPRGRVRVMRVARTIADLEQQQETAEEHVLAALSMRLRANEASR